MPTSRRNMLLRIDLSGRSAVPEEMASELSAYLGGLGTGVKLLVDELPPGADPLGAENKLVFSTGPLSGTNAPMFAQTCVVCKSPLSGTILNSYAGGELAAEIKQAGYDALVIEGRADEPLVVSVEGRKVGFHPAGEMAGMDTFSAADRARQLTRLPDGKVVSIGLAGERMVRFASALSEHRVFGRGGAGAVMGSKNLKALVVYGERPVFLADGDLFRAAVQSAMELINKELSSEYSLLGMFSRNGTGTGMSLVNERNALATRNHRFGNFQQASEIDGFAYSQAYPTRPISCFACPVHCGMLRTVPTGPLKGLFSRGPEYESMYALGSNLELGDREALFHANVLCDQYGLDTLTAGAVLGMVLEASERGLLPGEGPMEFGDSQLILALITKIAKREGIGDLLAEGPGRAAESIGGEAPEFAMQIKNSGYAAWMPRLMKGTGLSFATANRGACHKRAPIGAEIMGFVDAASIENKAQMVRQIQDQVNAYFTLVACRFSEFVLTPEVYLQLLEGASGLAVSPQDFTRLGERIWNLERVFNVAEGFRRRDDRFPAREMQPVDGQGAEAPRLTVEEVEQMLDEYYQSRGWDSDGVPTAAGLAALGLEGYAERMAAGQ